MMSLNYLLILIQCQDYSRLYRAHHNGENVQSLQVVEVVLVRFDLIDNQYQQESEGLYTFTPNKSYACLLNVETGNLVF